MSASERRPGARGRVDGDVVTEARAAEAAIATSATLRAVVIEGPDKGVSLLLDRNFPSRILVGTGPACQLKLSDPAVSRRHLALEPSGRRFRVLDLGSTNGTFVDGIAVVDAFVNGGEVVRCGSTAFSLQPDAAAAPAPAPSNAMRFGRVIGASESMRRLYPLCERLAASTLPILIEGETGTGKEVMAEALHLASGRKGAYVVFDCTAVASSLIEAELFGYERGAFTGAASAKPGLFEEADGGTLLIDEIGDLDPTLQPKLLRVIDRGEFRRVGGRANLRADVRVLAATRRDLDQEVAAGRFRDDLFHRLAIGRIELPPLRERRGDVALLLRHFAEELAAPLGAFGADWLSRFSGYHWPGNVRELRNTVVHSLVLGELADPAAGKSMPPPSPHGPPSGSWADAIIASGTSFSQARRMLIEEFEQRFIQRVLAAHGGNLTHAARASGLALRYFRLLKSRFNDPEGSSSPG